MDLLVAGPPGPLLRSTCDLILAAAGPQPVTVSCDCVGRDDVWAPREAPESGALRLLTSDHPADAFIAAVREHRLPALLVIDQPARSLVGLRGSGHELGPALRHLSASATLLGQLVGRRGVWVLTDESLRDVAPTMREVLNHVGLDLPAEGFASSSILQSGAPMTTLSQDEAELVDSVLAPAFQYAATGIRRPVIWPRSCLFWGDHPGEPAPRVIDMAGPARVLVYGPYFYLPPGRWIVRATMAFSQACRGETLTLEVHGSSEFVRSRFRVPQAGVFAIGCRFTVPSEREALEVRLVTERGAIEGTLGVDRIELDPEPAEMDQSVA